MVLLESLAVVQPLWAATDLLIWAKTVVHRHMGRSEESRRTLALASEWFRLADSTADPVVEFIYLWLVVEALAMPDTNIRRVVRLLGWRRSRDRRS